MIGRLVGLTKLIDVLTVDEFYLVYEWTQYAITAFYAWVATLSVACIDRLCIFLQDNSKFR